MFSKLDASENSLRAFESVGGVALGGTTMGGVLTRMPRVYIMPLVGGAAASVVERGNTIGVDATFYDEDNALFSPVDGVAEIKILKPDGTTVDWTSMDPRGTGHFISQLQIPEDGPSGIWRIKVRGALQSGNYLMNTIDILVSVVQ